MVDSINEVGSTPLPSVPPAVAQKRKLNDDDLQSIFKNGAYHRIKRKVLGEAASYSDRTVYVGFDDTGETKRVDEYGNELVTVSTKGKNTYITKADMEKKVLNELNMTTLPEGAKPIIIDSIIFINYKGRICGIKEFNNVIKADEQMGSTCIVLSEKEVDNYLASGDVTSSDAASGNLVSGDIAAPSKTKIELTFKEEDVSIGKQIAKPDIILSGPIPADKKKSVDPPTSTPAPADAKVENVAAEQASGSSSTPTGRPENFKKPSKSATKGGGALTNEQSTQRNNGIDAQRYLDPWHSGPSAVSMAMERMSGITPETVDAFLTGYGKHDKDVVSRLLESPYGDKKDKNAAALKILTALKKSGNHNGVKYTYWVPVKNSQGALLRYDKKEVTLDSVIDDLKRRPNDPATLENITRIMSQMGYAKIPGKDIRNPAKSYGEYVSCGSLRVAGTARDKAIAIINEKINKNNVNDFMKGIKDKKQFFVDLTRDANGVTAGKDAGKKLLNLLKNSNTKIRISNKYIK